MKTLTPFVLGQGGGETPNKDEISEKKGKKMSEKSEKRSHNGKKKSQIKNSFWAGKANGIAA